MAEKELTLVSIIIPVYQVSDYVERCLVSVINQTYKGIECIIVDDATEDDSIEKCERLIAGYSGPIRFKILHHEKNRGLSAARNTGTDAANGDYLYYLDSDDELLPYSIEHLLNDALANPCVDMVIGCTDKITVDGKESILLDKSLPAQLLSNEAILNCFYQLRIPTTAWNKLIKHSFIERNHIRFKEGIVFEDSLWMFYVVKYLSAISFVHEVTYNYYIRSGSIVTSADDYTVGNSYRIIFEDILRHLTPGRENKELNRYVKRYCRCYFYYKSVVPEYKNLHQLFRLQAKQHGNHYVSVVLITIGIVGRFGNPIRFLERLNTIRWEVKNWIIRKRAK